MDLAHNLTPDTGGGISVGVDAFGNIETGPHYGDIVGSYSGKPPVFVFTRGTGFAGDRDIVKPGFGAGTLVDGVPWNRCGYR